jgi:hypothetical protein
VALAAALVVLAIGVLAPYVRRKPSGPGMVLSAGLAYAVAAVGLPLAVDAFDDASPTAAAWGLLVAVAAAIALLGQTTALQHRPAARVAGPVLALEVAVPVLVAPIAEGGGWADSTLAAATLAASLALVLVAATILAASPPVTAAIQRGERAAR